MNDKFEQYASRQKQFWDVPTEQEAKFERVDTVSQGSESLYQQLAERTVQLVLEAAPTLQSDWTLLEVGCGVGRMINEMRQRVKFQKLYGIDISEKMIAGRRISLPSSTATNTQRPTFARSSPRRG